MCCIGTYFVGSVTYLYLPLIPDLAILRDRYRDRWLYRWLALGWHDTEAQRRLLERAISVMAIVIIPLAVSVHTVVSWVFAMTIQPMWHSSIFGPYFVIGAIYSGIATLIIAMAIVRRAYHLEEFVEPKHFQYLGYLLLTFAAMWGYFTFAEYLTTYYGGLPDEMRVFNAKVSGEFAGFFWTMVFVMVAAFLILTLPLFPARARRREAAWVQVLRPAFAGAIALLLVMTGRGYEQATLEVHSRWNVPVTYYHGLGLAFFAFCIWSLMPAFHDRPVLRTVVASLLVNVGMWLERFTIVVPTLSHPRLPWGVAVYHPTWIEWSLTAACFALFTLLFLVFSRFFPMLPVWEMQQRHERRQARKAADVPSVSIG